MLSTSDPQNIIKRFRSLQSERKTVEQTWQAIENYVAPYKGKFFREGGGEGGVEWNKRNLYDSTAVQAHIQLAASIHGALTNPAIQWFEMRWRSKENRDNQEAQEWIEAAGKRVYDELQDSNFNLEANNTYRTLTSFATSAIIEEPVAEPDEDWKGITFTSVPVKQMYFEPDATGQCRNFYRLLRWRASKIVSKFGIDTVPDRIKTAFEIASDQEFEVIFVAFERHESEVGSGTIIPPKKRPIGWAYIGGDDAHVYGEGGYYEQPAFIPRWETTDESMWGHGPAHYALADILTLNKMVELDLASREKVIDPAMLINERAVLTNLDLSAGAQNVVRDMEGMRAFESAARFDAVESTIVRLQMAVQRYFYIDQLELKQSPAMTATEVQVRYELMQRLLSSTMARLKEDFLNPCLQRTFNMLYRAGEITPPPIEMDLMEYDIEYIGPLSRSMKFDQSASVERWVTQLQLIAQLGGEAEQVLLVPDYDRIARQAAANLNLPADFTRKKEEVAADVEQAKVQQARAASAEAAANESAAAKNLGQAEQLRQGVPNIG